ncbi:HlyD family efflux transporter periplasmic adaptor subunit [Demequina sp. SYSU T00192]|uniref:HlyD family efflux transporter periplasmic adaptor subunit n=1 Tax=Demequina litoralis TaxID=3051660 RepID=A0ABT8GBU3_9MICO|nr:biotin/lipoyl-binding protein [Demequina sp. SYSU T00192]MDN4476134.1 HlyD family efflux transporter periplasmic adaptor subunit [Demequina sp. SYSU T00192]
MARGLSLAGRRRWILVAAPVAVGAVAAGAVLTGASSASATYRTATVESGDVTQTLTATGAIASASQEDLAFQVDGTVAKVRVAEGDVVEAGDVVARLDADDLEDAVTEAEEALADAKEALADDLEAQSTGSTSSTTAASASYSSGAVATTATVVTAVYTPADTRIVQAADDATDPAVEEARAALLAAQQALLDQYDVAQALLEAAQQAATDAQETCAAFTTVGDGGDDAVDGSAGDGGDDASDDAADGSTDATDALAACQEATAAALEASQDSIEAQGTLMDLAADVDAAVAALQEALADAGAGTGGSEGSTGGTGGSGGSSDGGGDASAGATGAPDGSTGAQGGDASGQAQGDASGGLDQSSGLDDATGTLGGSSSDDSASDQSQGSMSGGSDQEDAVPSAADILADKAEITAARAALKVAQQQVEHAVLRAPVAGTVVAVGMDEDDVVTAGDTATAITLVADNSYLVELSVSLTEAQLLAVGQEAELTLSSSGDVVDGVVSSVSNVNSGNDFAQAYAVTIAVPDPGFSIRIGAATRMRITVAGATGVLVVPTSAVADAAGDATVQVIGDDGLATQVSVETGAIGAVHTEIASGLEDGDAVILADLTADLTSDDGDDGDGSGGLLSGLSSEDESSDAPQMGQMPGGGMQQGGGMAPPGFSG